MKTGIKLAPLLLMLACNVAQAEWVRFYLQDDGNEAWEFDPARVVPLPDGNIKVWYQIKQSAKSKIASIEKLSQELDPSGRDLELRRFLREKISHYWNFSHTMHRLIFDCRQQRYADLESTDYSTDGQVLDRMDIKEVIAIGKSKGIWAAYENINLFNEIPPGSKIELLMKRVCK